MSEPICENCNGTGKDGAVVAVDPYPVVMPYPCGWCEGTGRRDEAREVAVWGALVDRVMDEWDRSEDLYQETTMSDSQTEAKPKKTLVLHIEVPGIYADDLPRHAAELSPDPTPEDYLFVVVEEWMRQEVGLTIVTLPGEKNMNDDFEVHAYTGRVVGAEVREGSTR